MKRCNGEGSIFKEPSGRYRIAVTKMVGGKKVRRTKTAHTRADAAAKLAELRGANFGTSSAKTIEAFLSAWMKDTVAPHSEITTVDSYERVIKNHINKHVGSNPIADFDKPAALEWLTLMGDTQAGTRTQQLAYVVFRSALNEAVDRLLVENNPFERIKKPAHEPAKIFPFTLAESKAIISGTAGTRNHASIYLAITCGFRGGELWGLEKDRILWNANKIRIDQQAVSVKGASVLKRPKTKCSVRTVDVPDSAMRALKDHLQIMSEEGYGGLSLVFPSTVGTITNRGGFRKWVWMPLLEELGFEHRGFHHTRHTYATVAIGANVPINVISQQLGHAKISTTYDLYGHVLEAHQKTANEALNQLFA